MAEPLSIFGGAVAAGQVTKAFIELGKVFGAAKGLSEDIELFCTSVNNMGKILPSLFALAEKSIDSLNSDERPKRQELLYGMLREFELIRKRLSKLATRIGLSMDLAFYDYENTVFGLKTRLKWFLSQSDITAARLLQETTKLSAQLFMSLMVCEHLMHRIKILEGQKGSEHIVRELTDRKNLMDSSLQNERRELRSSRRKLESFQKSHDDLIPITDITMIRKTEQVIVEKTTAIVPEARRRSKGSNRGRRSYTPSPHYTPFDGLSQQSRDQSSEWTQSHVSQVTRNTSLRRTSPAIRATFHPSIQPTHATNTPKSGHHPSRLRIRTEDLNPGHEATRMFTGSRVRDDGVQVREEVGQWPHQVLSAEDESSEQEQAQSEASVPESLERTQPPERTEVDRPPAINAFGERVRGYRENRHESHHSRETGDDTNRRSSLHEKWQPMPPFTRSDRSERERRRGESRKTDGTAEQGSLPSE